MKKTNKILLLVVLLALTLLLVSCKKPNKSPIFTIVDLDPENLVVDELDRSKNIESLNFYILEHSAATRKGKDSGASEIFFIFENGDKVNGNDLEDEEIDEALAKEYVYNLITDDLKEKIVITQFKKDSEINLNFNYVDYLTFNEKGEINTNGAVLTDTYLFEAKNIKFYEVTSGGVSEVKKDDITFTGFPEVNDLIVNRKYRNHETFEITGTTENDIEFNFQIRLAATEKPLNVKTATFWNWIFLQIPIAFLMALISGLFGNSFALGILFTTIIVRTLAWPIYAKTNDMSLKMSVAQPDMQRLERKYAMRKDPESQQRKQMEMMQIYKKHNISMWGCFLPILQMPIFLAMFQVVRRITIPGGQFYQSVANTKFLGTDLANGGVVAKLVFTALVGITMFALQKISQLKPSYAKKIPQQQKDGQQAQTEQTMKMVSFMMIFMMIITAYVTPGNALSFYWIIGNFFSMGQTLFNRFLNEKKYEKLQEEKLYGKSREIVDAKFKDKGGK
ncbi:MAG TPA: YidC/Oxa1 family membrane protein insertase [Acholeplasma sp.]|nr:YidC/Oxa1 family membrane protein insertase [Acholeplasma sp.]